MSSPANYVLGHSAHEQERLIQQACLMRPYTEKYFRAAAITPGMRVLDLGAGVGDVALLIAEIIGPGGRVLGLDRNGLALQRARQRAVEQNCSSWVSFQETSLDDFETTDKWEAVVGRYVLMYQDDASATLRTMLKFLKPGGIIAFHEVDLIIAHPSFPECPLWNQVRGLVPEALRRSGACVDFGRRLGKTYLDAGLPFPTIVSDTPVGGGRGSSLYALTANTVLTIAPRLTDLGLSLPPGIVADDTLAAQLEDAVVAKGSQLFGAAQFGAWARKPL